MRVCPRKCGERGANGLVPESTYRPPGCRPEEATGRIRFRMSTTRSHPRAPADSTVAPDPGDFQVDGAPEVKDWQLKGSSFFATAFDARIATPNEGENRWPLDGSLSSTRTTMTGGP